MAGLVILGLFTVVAGVLSGRSTIAYVLSRDAREAALIWTAEIDARLRKPETPERVLDEKLQVLNAVALHDLTQSSGNGKISLPAGPSFRGVHAHRRLQPGHARLVPQQR